MCLQFLLGVSPFLIQVHNLCHLNPIVWVCATPIKKGRWRGGRRRMGDEEDKQPEAYSSVQRDVSKWKWKNNTTKKQPKLVPFSHCWSSRSRFGGIFYWSEERMMITILHSRLEMMTGSVSCSWRRCSVLSITFVSVMACRTLVASQRDIFRFITSHLRAVKLQKDISN